MSKKEARFVTLDTGKRVEVIDEGVNSVGVGSVGNAISIGVGSPESFGPVTVRRTLFSDVVAVNPGERIELDFETGTVRVVKDDDAA